jgi:hypothetical protein
MLAGETGRFDELLTMLHAYGCELSASGEVLHKQWGLHLLEDWRSLELLAQAWRNGGGDG